jgi:methyl-accepting chemotaxis protein
MNRPQIKTALIVAFAIIGLIVGSFAAFAINRLQTINSSVEEITSKRIPTLNLAQTMAAQVAQLRTAIRDHILSDEQAAMQKFETRIGAINDALVKSLATYVSMQPSQAESDILRQVRVDLESYAGISTDIILLSRQDRTNEVKAMLYDKLAPVGDKITKQTSDLVEINRANAEAAATSSKRLYDSSVRLSVVAVGVTFAMIFGAIWYALYGIARPIQNITAAMKTLAAGDTASEVPYSGRADEIGEMASAVEVFRANSIANRMLEQEAEASRGMAEDERHQKAAADRARAEEMANATNGLGEGLRHLASGDLTFPADRSFRGRFRNTTWRLQRGGQPVVRDASRRSRCNQRNRQWQPRGKRERRRPVQAYRATGCSA